MNPMLQAALGSIIRVGLAALAWHLVEAGVWKEADAAIYVSGATIGLLTIGWSIYQKYVVRSALVVALASADMTEHEAKKIAASPIPSPSVTSSPDVVPVVVTPDL